MPNSIIENTQNEVKETQNPSKCFADLELMIIDVRSKSRQRSSHNNPDIILPHLLKIQSSKSLKPRSISNRQISVQRNFNTCPIIISENGRFFNTLQAYEL
jgi:hypothetical protein